MTTAPNGVTWLGFPLPPSQWPNFCTYSEAQQFVATYVQPALQAAFNKNAPVATVVDGANTPISILGGPPIAIVVDGMYQEAFKPSTPPQPGDVSSWIVTFTVDNAQCLDHVGDLINRLSHGTQIDKPWGAPGPYLNLIVLPGYTATNGPAPGVIELGWSPMVQAPLS